MTEPITRPGELARIARLANGDTAEYRTEVLMTLLSLKEADKRHAQWQQEHDRLDTERFASINSKLPGVVSGVGDYNDAKAQVLGAKRFALGVVAIIGLIGGAILGLIEIAKYFGQRSP